MTSKIGHTPKPGHRLPTTNLSHRFLMTARDESFRATGFNDISGFVFLMLRMEHFAKLVCFFVLKQKLVKGLTNRAKVS